MYVIVCAFKLSRFSTLKRNGIAKSALAAAKSSFNLILKDGKTDVAGDTSCFFRYLLQNYTGE